MTFWNTDKSDPEASTYLPRQYIFTYVFMISGRRVSREPYFWELLCPRLLNRHTLKLCINGKTTSFIQQSSWLDDWLKLKWNWLKEGIFTFMSLGAGLGTKNAECQRWALDDISNSSSTWIFWWKLITCALGVLGLSSLTGSASKISALRLSKISATSCIT